MILTSTSYADFKKIEKPEFGTVTPTVYYFDDTGGSGNFFLYVVWYPGDFAFQVATVGKPATFGVDYPGAVALTSALAIT